MGEIFRFTFGERRQLLEAARYLRETMGDAFHPGDEENLRLQIVSELKDGKISRDRFGLNPILLSFQTAALEMQEIGMRRECVVAILLQNSVINGHLSETEVEKIYGQSVAQIIHGLVRIHELYERTPSIESENFRNLLLSFAEDMRVILIMIADRVNLMRQIRDSQNNEARRLVAEEAGYLYAPLDRKSVV